MGRESNQSEGRRKNGAVPPWEITKGAGEGGTARKPAQPDQSTSGRITGPRKTGVPAPD